MLTHIIYLCSPKKAHKHFYLYNLFLTISSFLFTFPIIVKLYKNIMFQYCVYKLNDYLFNSAKLQIHNNIYNVRNILLINEWWLVYVLFMFIVARLLLFISQYTIKVQRTRMVTMVTDRGKQLGEYFVKSDR